MWHSPAEAALEAQNQSVPIPVQCRGPCSPLPPSWALTPALHSACSSACCTFPRDNRELCSTVPKFTQQGENRQRPLPAGGLS